MDPLIIRELDFTELGFPREFTFEERAIYRRTIEKHDLYKIQGEFTEDIVDGEASAVGIQRALEQLSKRLDKALQESHEGMDHDAIERYITQIRKLSGSDTNARRDYLDRLSTILAAWYEHDDVPDEETVDAMLARIEEQQNILGDSLNRDLNEAMKEHAEREWKWDELLKIVERVNLETVYEVGKLHHMKVGSFKDWLANATDEDHDNAERLVNEGKELRSLRRKVSQKPLTQSGA